MVGMQDNVTGQCHSDLWRF